MSKFSADEYASIRERLSSLKASTASPRVVAAKIHPASQPSHVPTEKTPANNGGGDGGGDGTNHVDGSGGGKGRRGDQSAAENVSEFQRLATELRSELMDTFSRFGIKYSVDAKVTGMLDHLSSTFNVTTSNLRAQLEDVDAIRSNFDARLAHLEQDREKMAKEMRQEEAERIRKLKLQHSRNHKSELNKVRGIVQQEYQEHYGVGPPGVEPESVGGIPLTRAEQRFKAKYKAKWERAWKEEQANKPGDPVLEARLETLQKQAVALVGTKDEELSQLRSELSRTTKEHTELKGTASKLHDTCAALRDAHSKLRVKHLEQESALVAVRGTKDKLAHQLRERDSGVRSEQDALLHKFQEQVRESTKLESELRARIRSLEERCSREGDKLAAAKDKNAAELDALNARIRKVLTQKDGMIAQQKTVVVELQRKLQQVEGMLNSI
jgi:predicted  nucleic acid-binding Zn-ribbon protein